MRMAIIGAPGAGKSTQAKRVARSLLYPNHGPRFSSGDLVRAEVEASTDLGREMEGYLRRGERVPDEMLLPLLLPRLRRSGGFVLDDFPATASQARALDEDLEGRGAGALRRVICLEGPTEEEFLERILKGRRTSGATGEIYHLQNDPPPGPSERLDPGPFLRRSDDTEESIRARLEAYRNEAEVLKEHYEEAGLLAVVDASLPMGEVTEAILEALGHPERPEFYARPKGGSTGVRHEEFAELAAGRLEAAADRLEGKAEIPGTEGEASKSRARAQELRVAALLVREEAEAVAREEGEASTRMIAENLSLEAQG